MKAQWTALLALALAATLGVGTARADWQTDRAQAIAAKVWHDPCAGRVTVAHATPPEPDWRAWTFPTTCTILLSDQPPTWGWSELCPVLMHEYGHLAGFTDPLNPSDPTHSHNPRSIMWPVEHYDRRCDGYGAPYLGLARRRAASRPRAAAHRRAAARHRATSAGWQAERISA